MRTEQKNECLVCFGAGRGAAVGSLSERVRTLRSRAILLTAIVNVVPLCTVSTGQAEPASEGGLAFADPYVYVDRFTNSPDVKALGFPIGPKPFLSVGMVVEKEEAEKVGTPIDIVSAKATNGKVTFDLIYADIGVLDLWDNWEEIPEFDAENHKGTWTITATDSKGVSAESRPVLLEYGFEIPFVENVRAEELASGDLKIAWSVPELDPEIVAKCDIDYRVRLLHDDAKQLFRSDPTTETAVTVPASIREEAGGSLDGLWGKVEMACRDKERKDENGVGELEARSNTFVPLR